MQNILSIALEPEMSRFYHSCMDGAHGNLMDFRALYRKESLQLFFWINSVTYWFKPGMVKRE
jgi:hypothetical protein